MPKAQSPARPDSEYRGEADLHGRANALPPTAATALFLAQVRLAGGQGGDPQKWIERTLLGDKVPSKQ